MNIKTFLPFLRWFEGYNLHRLQLDLVSGVTVALVLIPQSMAYAQLADLPAYYGLYAAFLPPIIAALFGSSNQLATGPVAIVSLMTATALAPFASAGSEQFIAYAIMLAVMVGAFQFLLGVFKLGLVVNFLSHPVVNGFTNAAALIIATSQLSKIFGVSVDRYEHHYETIYHVILSALQSTHMPTFGLAILAFATMYFLKKLDRRIPNVLVAVVLTTVISYFIGFEKNQIVKIDQFKSPQVAQEVTGFNHEVTTVDSLVSKRVEFASLLSQAKNNKQISTDSVLMLDYTVTLLNEKIHEHKLRIRSYRERLREYRFVRTDPEPADEELTQGGVFYRKNSVPKGIDVVDKGWKFKVGNKPLKINEIKMIGGGAVVGVIPQGLPSLKMPRLDFTKIFDLLAMAVIISLLGFMEAISIAKAMAAKTGQRLDPNQELIGQGLSNMIGAIGQSYPVSGSFSRSAVNLQAGAVTGLSNAFSSLVVGLTLLFFTPLLYHLPQAVLAAIIMMAVIGLVNVSGFIHAYKAQKFDGTFAVITFVCTLGFAPHLDRGIMIGVGLSLVHYLLRSTKPDVAILSKFTDGTFRNADRRGLKKCKHIAVVRFNNSLFFANTNYLEDKVLDLVASMPELKQVHIVCNGINELDASGEDTISLLVTRLREAGIGVSFSGLNEAVMDVMLRTHLLDKIGLDNIYGNVELAVRNLYERTHRGSNEADCPLRVIKTKPLEVSPEMLKSMRKQGKIMARDEQENTDTKPESTRKRK